MADEEFVPELVRKIKYYLNFKNFRKNWWVYLIAIIIILYPVKIKSIVDQLYTNAKLESNLMKSNQKDYNKINPPLPLCINDSIHFKDYVRNIPKGTQYTVTFIVGPSGAGKSIFRRQILKELYDLQPKNQPIVIRLNKLGVGQRMNDEYYGNEAQYCNLDSPLKSEIQNFESFISNTLYVRYSKEFDLRYIKTALSKKAKKSLNVVIDDFDEVHRFSRSRLINLIYTTLKNETVENLNLFIMSRADALIEQPSINELYELDRESGKNICVNVARIVPFSSEMSPENYELYLNDARSWGAKKKSEFAQSKIDSIKNISEEILNEFLSWVDGANAVYEYFADDYPDNEEYFIDAMRKVWYRRSMITHLFPSVKDSKQYITRSGEILNKVDRECEYLDDVHRPLLFTGLIELVPVKLSQGRINIRPQFPSLQKWYADNANNSPELTANIYSED